MMGRDVANKDPERRAKTRRRIMQACWDVYAADPSRIVTVSAIVSAAGVHRSTFYEYFDDAPAVMAALEAERALATGGTDPEEIVQRVYVAHGERLSLLLGDAGDPGFSRKLKRVLRPVAERGLGLGEGGFDPYLFEFAVSGILAAVTLWYERGRDIDPGKFGEGLRSVLSSVFEMAVRS